MPIRDSLKSIANISGLTTATMDKHLGIIRGVSEAVSDLTRTHSAISIDDEVNYRPAAWQQAACTP